jgi:hypothetical protein|eukprot:COSAG01_NODE_5998_length_3908_cov_11.208454_1_plen_190_part_00
MSDSPKHPSSMGLLASVALADSGIRIEGCFVTGVEQRSGVVAQAGDRGAAKRCNKRSLGDMVGGRKKAQNSSTSTYDVGDSGDPARPFKCLVPGCNYTATRRRCAAPSIRALLALRCSRIEVGAVSCEGGVSCVSRAQRLTQPATYRYVGEHMITHTGLKPHKCPHCSYRTTGSGHLRRHIRSCVLLCV